MTAFTQIEHKRAMLFVYAILWPAILATIAWLSWFARQDPEPPI